MDLKTLRQLDIGTKLQLKGTNVIFELLKIDYHDDERPLRVMVLETDRPILVRLDAAHREDDVVIYRHGLGNTGWPFNDKKTIREDAGLDESEFKRRITGYYVVTLSDLEVYENKLEVGHTETIEVSESTVPVLPLPASEAKAMVKEFEEYNEVINIINKEIANKAQHGQRSLQVYNVSESILEMYTQAGYTIENNIINW